jgi:hypothetical protein
MLSLKMDIRFLKVICGRCSEADGQRWYQPITDHSSLISSQRSAARGLATISCATDLRRIRTGYHLLGSRGGTE